MNQKMKSSLALLALAFVTIGSAACSSAPKQEETSSLEASMNSEPPVAEQAPAADSSKSNLSLGAGSSGRGH